MHVGHGDTNCIWRSQNGSQSLGKRARSDGNQRMNRDHPDYSIVEIGLIPEKTPEETCYHSYCRGRLSVYAGLKNQQTKLVCRVFENGPGDLGSIPGRVIPKTLKMVLDTYLLNTQQYKVRIKGKVQQSRERSSALPYTTVQQLLKREPSGRTRQKGEQEENP